MDGPKLKLGICVLQLEKLHDTLKENTNAHPSIWLKVIQMAVTGHTICQAASSLTSRRTPSLSNGSQNRQLSKTID